jgi:hypothetical protein
MDDYRLLTTGDGCSFPFQHVALRFGGAAVGDAFALKNNKSLGETLAHARYRGLAQEMTEFSELMGMPLGEFLLDLKLRGHPLYKRFLNRHGDKPFSVFTIEDATVVGKKGIYAYFAGDTLRYIGRCRDTMKRRINQGYGKIHPKNCYIDGQSTNCHLNARITEAGDTVSLWFCPLDTDDEIIASEVRLIRKYQPEWNTQIF